MTGARSHLETLSSIQSHHVKVERIRKVALELLIAKKGYFVRKGPTAGLYKMKFHEFRLYHQTPFNRAPPPPIRTEIQRFWVESHPQYRYGIKILQERSLQYHVAWDNEGEIHPLWFRQEYRSPWDERFIRLAARFFKKN